MNPQLVANLPPWSYTFLNEYQICPWRCFNKYIAKTTKYVEGPAQKWGNTVHNAMDQRISSGVPLPAEMAKFEPWAAGFDGQKVQTEQKLGVRQDGSPCGFFDKDVYGRMRLDVVVEPGDFTARLFDWKTGKIREDNFELRLQALFVQARNPELRKIYGWFVWLGDGATGSLGAQHDCSDVETTWAEVDARMHAIRMNAAINHWPMREGPLCGYCDVLDCKNNRSKR